MEHLCMARLMQFVAYVFFWCVGIFSSRVVWNFGLPTSSNKSRLSPKHVRRQGQPCSILARIDASMPRLRTTTAMAIISRGDPLSVDDNRQCRLTMMVRDSFSATAMLTARW